MLQPRIAAFGALVLLLSACGAPVLDSSNPQRLVDSVEKLRKSIDPDESARFEDALGYFTDRADFTRDPETLGPVVDACAPIEGLTAREIILAAWTTRVAVLERRISDLSSRREASVSDREILAGFEVVEARLYPAVPGFVNRAVVEAVVENHTGRRVDLVSFRVSLRLQDEIEPWITEVIDRPIGVGLAPGSRSEFRLETQDVDWKQASDGGSAGIFVCEVMQLVGRGRKTIAASDFGTTDEFLLEALEKRLTKLRTEQPAT